MTSSSNQIEEGSCTPAELRKKITTHDGGIPVLQNARKHTTEVRSMLRPEHGQTSTAMSGLSTIMMELESARTPVSSAAAYVPTTSLLDLPFEIRHQIYQNLADTEHTIILRPRVACDGPLHPLQRSCKQIDAEIKKWRKCAPQLTSTFFGLVDFEQTTFKMCLIYTHVYTKKAPLTHSDTTRKQCSHIVRKIQRVYPRALAERDISNIETIKKAMDKCGSMRVPLLSKVGDISLSEPFTLHGNADTPAMCIVRRKTNFALPCEGQYRFDHGVANGWEVDKVVLCQYCDVLRPRRIRLGRAIMGRFACLRTGRLMKFITSLQNMYPQEERCWSTSLALPYCCLYQQSSLRRRAMQRCYHQ